MESNYQSWVELPSSINVDQQKPTETAVAIGKDEEVPSRSNKQGHSGRSTGGAAEPIC
jgi:hypothetical protein